jgi:hypothetical protein
MPHPRATVICALALALAGGCTRRERPEDTLARSKEVFVRGQIAGLEKTIGQVERGEVTTTDQVAIGLSEDLAKGLLNASLPLETVVANRLRVTVDSAEPFFRGTKAAILFRATVASVDISSASASVDIGGGIQDFALARGRLRARVALTHFNVRESGLGDLAADVIDGLIRAHLATIQDAIPPLEIPVELEESIAIGGLAEGPVVAKAGVLPLDVAVTQVIVGNRRLWVLLKAEAGVWQPAPSPAEASEKAR